MPPKRVRATPPKLYKRYGSKKYYVRFTANGQRIAFSTGAEDRGAAWARACRFWEEQTGLAFNTDTDADDDGLKAHFEEYADHLDKLGRHDDTIRHHYEYARRYTEFFGSRRTPNNLTWQEISSWRDWLLKQKVNSKGRSGTLAPKTVGEHLTWLSSILKFFSFPNQVHRVERPKSKRPHVDQCQYFNAEEVRALLKNAQEDFRNYLEFLFYTGCRVGGPMSIINSPEWIDGKNRRVKVHEKGDKIRWLDLHGEGTDKAWRALKREIKRRKVGEGEPVFHQYRNFAYKRMEALCEIAEVPRKKSLVHAIRHTFAAHALSLFGWDIGYLAQWLGHEDVRTTYLHYGHLVPRKPPKISYAS